MRREQHLGQRQPTRPVFERGQDPPSRTRPLRRRSGAVDLALQSAVLVGEFVHEVNSRMGRIGTGSAAASRCRLAVMSRSAAAGRYLSRKRSASLAM